VRSHRQQIVYDTQHVHRFCFNRYQQQQHPILSPPPSPPHPPARRRRSGSGRLWSPLLLLLLLGPARSHRQIVYNTHMYIVCINRYQQQQHPQSSALLHRRPIPDPPRRRSGRGRLWLLLPPRGPARSHRQIVYITHRNIVFFNRYQQQPHPILSPPPSPPPPPRRRLGRGRLWSRLPRRSAAALASRAAKGRNLATLAPEDNIKIDM